MGCLDVRGCTLGAYQCSPLATCADAADSFTCTCCAGYDGDGLACADVDECKQPPRNMARACWDA
eukprot:2011782-Rhodomonas_salina.1